jgi:hypothetical protein
MIAGIGFAMMAWELAQSRFGKHPDVVVPHRRIESYFLSASENEYYRILDDAWGSWNSLTTYAKRNWEPRYYL